MADRDRPAPMKAELAPDSPSHDRPHQGKIEGESTAAAAAAAAATAVDSTAKGGHYGAVPPIDVATLDGIVQSAIRHTLQHVVGYNHSHCYGWNADIIQTILTRVAGEMKTARDAAAAASSSATATSGVRVLPAYKLAVNATIVQQAMAGAGEGEGAPVAQRGMHSATAGYWNPDTDGMWNCKVDLARDKGLAVIVSVIWMAVP
ncbi:MAG: hypothetical protein M1826_005751 [Phylliscum demangeonii]|nr:MAG: hypothetical protein M1826_005751 [Phylliscum demangeonii]